MCTANTPAPFCRRIRGSHTQAKYFWGPVKFGRSDGILKTTHTINQDEMALSMSPTLPPYPLPCKNSPSFSYDGPIYWLYRHQRAAREWVAMNNFSLTVWANGLNASDLTDKDKETARHIAANAHGRGYSTIDNSTLAILAGVSRENTISDRLRRIRAAGFLDVHRKFNSTSLHVLTCPMGVDPHPLDRDVRDLVKEATP